MSSETPPRNRPAENLIPLTHVAYHLLLSLSGGEKHGYGIIKDVATRTEGEVELEAGTLYAAIKRMLDDNLLSEVPGPKGTDARRRYYAVTTFGLEVLRLETARLEKMVKLAREADLLASPPPAKA